MLEATKPVCFDPLSVRPVTVRVSQGNPSDVARLLDENTPISPAEYAEFERRA
jgi:hypothetical protein